MRPQILLSVFLSFCTLLIAESSMTLLLGDFEAGWEKNWETKLLYKRGNQFHVVTEDSNKVLRVDSARSASGMFREIKQRPIEPGKISWRWKVKSSLESNSKERSKAGD